MTAAERFTAMAARIAKINASEFAGAVVIVPPGDSGPIIEFLEQDPTPLAAQFWTNVKNRVEIAGSLAQDADVRAQPWGNRR